MAATTIKSNTERLHPFPLVSAIAFAVLLDVVLVMCPATLVSKMVVFLGLPGILLGVLLGLVINGWCSVVLTSVVSISLNTVLYYYFFRLTAKAWNELWES
jgi:hypothetical protein